MNQTNTPQTVGFPLDTIGKCQEKLYFPTDEFDAFGGWELRFGIYSTAGGGAARIGEFTLTRTVEAGQATLALAFNKLHTNGRQFIDATMTLGDDAISTPTSWEFRAIQRMPNGTVIPDLRITKRFRVEDGQIRETRILPGARRDTTAYPIDGPYTLSWTLFDAITRMPREAFEPQRFTLIDHFDQIKSGQVVSYRSTSKLDSGGKTHELTAYDQVGRGILPTVWYCDTQGRPIAVVAGIETFLLEPAEA